MGTFVIKKSESMRGYLDIQLLSENHTVIASSKFVGSKISAIKCVRRYIRHLDNLERSIETVPDKGTLKYRVLYRVKGVYFVSIPYVKKESADKNIDNFIKSLRGKTSILVEV